MKKNEYISYKMVDQIIKKNKLQYLIMLGQRSNGKSYASKELAIRSAWKHNAEFCYLRRRKQDIQDYMVLEYFADMMVPNKAGQTKIAEITDGIYNEITLYRKGIYFCNTDEEGKVTRGPRIGYAHALSGLEGLKSRQFPKVEYILYEEFIATGLYLYDEPNKLQNYVSTIFRDKVGTVIMIGNTISRVVPYFQEWELDMIPRQQQGTVDLYNFKTDNTTTTIGVFLCNSLQHNSGMFFGNSAKMITGGLWDREEKAHLEKTKEDYYILYEMVFHYSDTNQFLMSFLQDKEQHNNLIWYVEPKTTEIKRNTRVIDPTVNESFLYSSDFIPINDNEDKLFQYLKIGKICYSDNLTGTEFERCRQMLNPRKMS